MFLNPLLLWGTAAGTIPLVIHLINRSRYRPMPWGAMHLLEQILHRKRRRLRIEQLLLLAVRIAIPILLAVALALPVLTGMEQLLGQAKTSLVLLIDNSDSMNAVAPAQTQSQLALARQAAEHIINALPRGSDVSIVWLSDPGRFGQASSFDRRRIQGRLSAMTEGYGSADVAAGLEAAAGLLEHSHHAHREIVVISDFQKVSWSDQAAGGRSAGIDRLQSLAPKPYLGLLRVGEPVADNVAVESLHLSGMVLGIRQELRVRANIRNFGPADYADMQVSFRVDGRQEDITQIQLAPKEIRQVLFRHTFAEPGSHHLEVVAEADSLRSDNGRRVSIPVWDSLPVLLVDGDPRPEPLRSETGYLQIALQPFTVAQAQSSDLIAARRVTPDQLQADDLGRDRARVVVLANVPQLDDARLGALAEFVKQGGGLLIFPGDRIDLDWYNGPGYRNGAGLLARRLAAPAGETDDRRTSAGIAVHHYEHPALEFFNDPQNGSLAYCRVRRWYPLASAGRPAEATDVLAQLDNGDPFLVEKSFGAGRVILCATAGDADWSNLPLRPSYLPLMQRLVTYLASKVHPPRNLQIGESLAAFLPLAQVGQSCTLTDPDGQISRLTIRQSGAQGLIEYDQTTRPGLYLLESPDGQRIHYVVETDPAESDLTLLGDKAFAAMARQMNAQPLGTVAEYLALNEQRRLGQPLWQVLLAGVLGLLLLEMLLQQWFSRAR